MKYTKRPKRETIAFVLSFPLKAGISNALSQNVFVINIVNLAFCIFLNRVTFCKLFNSF